MAFGLPIDICAVAERFNQRLWLYACFKLIMHLSSKMFRFVAVILTWQGLHIFVQMKLIQQTQD